MMNRTLFFFFILLCGFPCTANNVQIQDLVYDANASTLSFNVSWENGFNTTTIGYSLAYVFIKYRNSNDPNWHHLLLNQNSILSYDPSYCIIAAEVNLLNSGEYMGIAVGPGCSFTDLTNSSNANITIDLDGFFELINPSFKVFAIEFVRRNITAEGQLDYYIGDGISENRFHKGDDPSEPFFYSSPGPYISVGNGPDDINTTSATPLPITSIPFHYFDPQLQIMRYEISQAQYVDFLNCLSREAQNQRTAADISGTAITNRYVMSNSPTMINRNGIKCDATLPAGGPVNFYCDLNENDVPNETNDGQNIGANYLSPTDLMAYLDWAGLKPMNEAQYEYYARGQALPVPGEYAWGNTMKTAVTLNISASGGPDEIPTNIGAEGLFRRSPSPMRTGAAATITSSRSQAGASYFGVMDLSGNVAEMVIGSYSPSDFEPYIFQELEGGDGILSILGAANENWPAQLVTKGYAPSNSILHSVSHRHPGSNPYIGPNERNAYAGGRGVFD